MDAFNWEDGAREAIRNCFDSIANKVHINRFNVPVFIFCIIVIILMQVLGNKLNKPIINIAAIGVGIFFLIYFNLI